MGTHFISERTSLRGAQTAVRRRQLPGPLCLSNPKKQHGDRNHMTNARAWKGLALGQPA